MRRRRWWNGWRVALYERLDTGKPGKHTFDVLYFWTREEARIAQRNHRGDRRFVPVIERDEPKEVES